MDELMYFKFQKKNYEIRKTSIANFTLLFT
jgi:hypothetical protein